jgi:RES domain-containing protein
MSLLAEDPLLQSALRRAPASRYDDYAFRVVPGGSLVHNLKFEHLWSGNSAGRCNPAGVFRLYLAADKKTADAEFNFYAAKAGLNPDLAERYGFAATVKLERVLDLSDGSVRRLVGITRDEILADWEPDPLLPPPPPTLLQSIGYWVSQGYGNFSAMLYPSARRSTGRNLVAFKGHFLAGDSIVSLSTHPTAPWP